MDFWISWKDDLNFSISNVDFLPFLCSFPLNGLKDVILEEAYEIQEKAGILNSQKYAPLNRFGQTDSKYYSKEGFMLPTISNQMPPTSDWIWVDDWHVQYSLSDNGDGWIYLKHLEDIFPKPAYSTPIRIRRWCRPRQRISLEVESDSATNGNSTIVYSEIQQAVEAMSPFLKALYHQVLKNSADFDFATISAVPSPRLRRLISEVKINK